MRNFYQNDDDDEFLDGYLEESDEDTSSINDVIDFAQIDLLDRRLNQALLNETISLLSKSFFWKFKSLDSKLEMIDETYKKLQTLIEHNNIEE